MKTHDVDIEVEAPRTVAADGVLEEWEVGDIILDRYEVVSLLGEGGMGKVHKLHHAKWDLDLAVKSPRGHVITDGGVDSFIKEAQTWVRLGLHPHIVVCYYVRVLGGVPRLFTELVTGGDLATWIHRGRLYEGGQQVALERILDIAIQFCWGLHHAHTAGLVHQDVKPGNVMLLPDGTAKVSDFGIAEYVRITETSSATSCTPAYASPEQMSGRPVSRTTDIWSWAVSVMEMFMRRWPNFGPEAAEVLQDYLAEEVDDGIHPRMPRELASLLGSCFGLQPEWRPPSMIDVAESLLNIYECTIGYTYPRPRPGELDMRADFLCNSGVSLMDLGESEEARTAFDAAVLADPWHLYAGYNREMLRWRSGDITDEDLLDRMRELQTARADRWTLRYLNVLVQRERGDTDAAIDELLGADREAEENPEAMALLDEAKKSKGVGHVCHALVCQHPQQAAAISADGTTAVSGGEDGVLIMWDVEKSHLRRSVKLHTGPILALTRSFDGTLFGSAGADGTARVVDLKGRTLFTMSGHRGAVKSVAVAIQGVLTVTGSEQGVIRFFDRRGKLLRSQESHHGSVNGLALSEDRRRLASVSDDGRLGWWDVELGTLIVRLADHTGPVHCVCLTPDGHVCLTGGEDGYIKVWNMVGGECIRTLSGHRGPVRSLAIRADGLYALSVGDDATMRVWEVSTGRCLYTVRSGTGWLHAIDLTPDGATAVVASSDMTLQVWQVVYDTPPSPAMLVRPRSSAELIDNRRTYLHQVDDVEQYWNQGYLDRALDSLIAARAVPGYERSPQALELWTTMLRCGTRVRGSRAWIIRTLEGHYGPITGLCIDRSGRFALSGSEDATLRAWDLVASECLLTLPGQRSPVQGVAMRGDAQRAVSFGEDTDLVVWDLTCGRETHRLTGHLRRVRGVAMTPDGRVAVSVAQDGRIRVWDIETGTSTSSMKAHGEHLAITPDGRILALATTGGRVRIFDVRTGKCLQVLRGHVGAIHDVALTPDARFAVSAGEDGTVQVFDLVRGGRRITVLQGHQRSVLCVDVSQDGRHVISGGRDRTLRLWNVEDSLQEPTLVPPPLRLMGHSGPVTNVKLNADASQAVSASADGLVRVWHLDWELKTHPVAMWDADADVCLEAWMSQQAVTSTRKIRPLADRQWDPRDFESLQTELSCWGFGYLHPGGIKDRLLEVAPTWEGPVDLPITNIHEDE